METVTRRFQFCAGHRILGHENKCGHFHGHNYVALVTVAAPKLDKIGRVVDFAVIKEKVGEWIDANWDHGFLVWDQDKEARAALALVDHQKVHLMRDNPTAENMAAILKTRAAQLLNHGQPQGNFRVVKVVLWETENCYAEATE
jgi:6-pyruvoyltetrahydropterin/6-carboxytetrahydropterin synthase